MSDITDMLKKAKNRIEKKEARAEKEELRIKSQFTKECVKYRKKDFLEWMIKSCGFDTRIATYLRKKKAKYCLLDRAFSPVGFPFQEYQECLREGIDFWNAEKYRRYSHGAIRDIVICFSVSINGQDKDARIHSEYYQTYGTEWVIEIDGYGEYFLKKGAANSGGVPLFFSQYKDPSTRTDAFFAKLLAISGS